MITNYFIGKAFVAITTHLINAISSMMQYRRTGAWWLGVLITREIHITKIHKWLWQIVLICMCSSRWDTVCCIDVFLSGGRVTHICVSKLDSIGSDVACSGTRHVLTNAGLLSIGPLGTNFSEIQSNYLNFHSEKTHVKISSVTRRLFCRVLNAFW